MFLHLCYPVLVFTKVSSNYEEVLHECKGPRRDISKVTETKDFNDDSRYRDNGTVGFHDDVEVIHSEEDGDDVEDIVPEEDKIRGDNVMVRELEVNTSITNERIEKESDDNRKDNNCGAPCPSEVVVTTVDDKIHNDVL